MKIKLIKKFLLCFAFLFPLPGPSAIAQDTEVDINSGTIAVLANPGSFSATPTTSSDITFTIGTYTNTAFTEDFTFGIATLNDLNTGQFFTITGNGTAGNTITLNGANDTISGSVPGDLIYVVDGGNLTLQSTSAANFLNFILAADGNFDVAGTGVLAIGGTTAATGSSISGAHVITKIGTGTLVLNGANSFSGLVIANGVVNLGFNALAAGSGTITLGDAAGGNATLIGTGSPTISNTITLGAGATANGFTLTIENGASTANQPTFSGAVNLNGDNLTIATIGFGNVSASGDITGIGNLTLVSSNQPPFFGGTQQGTVISGNSINNTGTITNTGVGPFATIISSTIGAHVISVTENGAAPLILSGVNTYTGPTVITAGMIQFAKESSLYNNNTASWTAANILVRSGATLGVNVGGTGEFTAGDVGILLASGIFKSGAILGLDVTNSGGSFNWSNAITNTNGGANVLGLTKLGTGLSSGTLTLSGTNTYTGPTTVVSGTLQAGSPSAFGVNSALTVSGGTIDINGDKQTANGEVDLNGNNITVGNLDGSVGTFIFNSATATASTFTIGGGNGDGGTYAGQIEDNLGVGGTLALTKIGTGTITLSGANTYSGGTTISGGTLFADNSSGSATGTRSITVQNGATLSGSGAIRPTMGTNAITVAAGGNLAPGGVQPPVSPTATANGGLTLDPTNFTGTNLLSTPDSTIPALTFALGTSNTSSPIVVTGSANTTISFGGGTGGTTVISINDLTSGNLTLNQIYMLIQGNGSTSYSGLSTMTTSISGVFQITGGLTLLSPTLENSFSENYGASQLFLVGNDIEIEVGAIPEPSTWGALILGGMALLVVYQRRQKRKLG